MQHPDGWKGKWTRCWNERLLSWVWKKKFKKIKPHTSNTHDHKRKGDSFGAWILHSFPSNQAVLLHLWVKTETKPTAKQGREKRIRPNQVSLAGFWYPGLVKCISHTLCCQQHPPLLWSCNHLPARCSRAIPSSFLSQILDFMEYILTPWHLNGITAEWQQAWPVNIADVTTEARAAPTDWRSTNLIIIRQLPSPISQVWLL